MRYSLVIKLLIILTFLLLKSLVFSQSKINYLDRYFRTIEKSKFIIKSNEVESITGMDFSNDNNLCVSLDYNYVWIFDDSGDIKYQFGREKYKPFTANNNVIWRGEKKEVIVSHIIHGRSYYSIYSKSGLLELSQELHPLYINKLIYSKDSETEGSYIGGLDIYNFKSMLEKYDTDSFFLSKKNKDIWRNYFEHAQGHWITRLNQSNKPIDSLYTVKGNMRIRNKAAYQNMFSFDIDSTQHVWLYAFPDSAMKVFNKKGELTKEVMLKKKDLKIPQIISEKEWEYYKKKDEMYFDYTLHIIEPYVFFTYETKNKDLTNSSRRMAIYTIDGKFLDRFDFPYKPYKHNNALYFWMKEDNELRLMKCIK